MALGAQARALVGMVLRGNLFTGVMGTTFGLVGAFWASRLLSRFLFGVEPWDPLTYTVVALLSMLVCLVAGYVPARRIATIDPVEVLRAE